jgi:hypothetical protein
MEINFTPRLCEMDSYAGAVPDNYSGTEPALCKCGVLCRGCGFKKREQKENPIVCDKDRIEHLRNTLQGKDRDLLNQLITDMLEKRTGFFPVELAVKYAYDVIDDIHSMGKDITGFRVEQKEKQPKFDVRGSDTTHKCAIPVYLARKEKELGRVLKPKSEKNKYSLSAGTLYHTVSLTDFKQGNKAYMPNFYLSSCRDRQNCENSYTIELEINDEKIIFEFTPDAVYKIGNSLLIVDLKSGRSPPFAPHRGYARQVTSYGIGLEHLLSELKLSPDVKAEFGLLVYAKKLGKGFSIRHFAIDGKSEEGKSRCEETIDFIYELHTSLRKFNKDPNVMLDYRDNINKRCSSSKGQCYDYDFCHTGGLKNAIEVLATCQA